MLVALKNPRGTEQAYAAMDAACKEKEEEHQHAFWQGQEYKRAVEEGEARVAALEADVERYQLQADRYRVLCAEVRELQCAVFAGVHPDFPHDAELRERIDVVAAHGVEFASKLATEREALRAFPAMLEHAERAERQFAKADCLNSDNRRRHIGKAEFAYARARRAEAAVRRIKPSIAAYGPEMPSFSFVETGKIENLFVSGHRERREYCQDLVAHMHGQWDIARRDADEMAAGVRELNKKLKALEAQLERMRARILLTKAAEMGVGEDVQREIDRIALADEANEGADMLDLSSPFTAIADPPPPAYSKPPEYSKH